MEKKKKPIVTLFGVTVDPRVLPVVMKRLRGLVKEGQSVGVEYTEYHYGSRAKNNQDIFWEKLIDFLKSSGCKVVFLDDWKMRAKIDLKHKKKQKLILSEAKIILDKREDIFMRRIALNKTKLNVLGAAHAIRLQGRLNAKCLLEPVALEMHERKLIPLRPASLINPQENLRREKELNIILSSKRRVMQANQKTSKLFPRPKKRL